MQYESNEIKQLIVKLQELTEELEIVDEILESIFEDDSDLLFEEEKKKWIQNAIKKEGALHKSLKVKKGEKIPEKKLEKASHKGGKLGKRARLAMTLRKLKKGKKEEKGDEKKELKEDLELAAAHSVLSDKVKSEGKSMKKEDLHDNLFKIATIENKLGKEAKPGYSPWLVIDSAY
jgi:hypothetical protein